MANMAAASLDTKVLPVIELGEGLRDSPKFRSSLEDRMMNVENLECKLEKLLKVSHTMVDAGKHLLNTQQ